MRSLLLRASLVLLALWFMPKVFASTRTVPESIKEWPVVVNLTATGVRVRAQAGTTAKIVGEFRDPNDSGTLIIVDGWKGEDEFPWFKVLSEKSGVAQGWVYGKYLDVESPRAPLERYFPRVRRDFGYTSTSAQQKWGKPIAREESSFRIDDLNIPVSEITLTFANHQAVYWKHHGLDRMCRLEVSGGPLGFGDLQLGDSSDEVERKLGSPLAVKNRVWTYRGPLQEIHVKFDIEARVIGLIYDRSLFS